MDTPLFHHRPEPTPPEGLAHHDPLFFASLRNCLPVHLFAKKSSMIQDARSIVHELQRGCCISLEIRVLRDCTSLALAEQASRPRIHGVLTHRTLAKKQKHIDIVHTSTPFILTSIPSLIRRHLRNTSAHTTQTTDRAASFRQRRRRQNSASAQGAIDYVRQGHTGLGKGLPELSATSSLEEKRQKATSTKDWGWSWAHQTSPMTLRSILG